MYWGLVVATLSSYISCMTPADRESWRLLGATGVATPAQYRRSNEQDERRVDHPPQAGHDDVERAQPIVAQVGLYHLAGGDDA